MFVASSAGETSMVGGKISKTDLPTIFFLVRIQKQLFFYSA